MSGTSATVVRQSRSATVEAFFTRRAARYSLAIAVFLVATGAYFAPVVAHLDSRVLVGFSDATSAIRNYDVVRAAGATPFTFRHDRLNGAPEGVAALPQTQVAQPIQPTVIWGLSEVVGTVAALNLFILAGFVLTAFAGFALLDWARFGILPSLFGGFVIAFNPWMVERAIAGHAAFMHGWTLVLVLAALTKLRSERTLRWAALTGAACGVCFLFAAYTGFMATAFVVAFAVAELVAQRSGWEWLWTCTILVVIGGVMFLALIPGVVAVAYDKGPVASDLSHGTQALQSFGATPADYVLPVERHPVLGLVGHLRASNLFSVFHERDVFVGYVVLALALATLVRLIRRRLTLPEGVARNLVVLSSVVIPIAFVASMKRQLSVLGIDVPMPSYLLGEITTFYRVYARFGYVVEIGLAVLASAALYHLLSRGRRGLTLAIASVLVGITVFEFLPGTLSTIAVDKPPAYDAWLAHQPRGIAAHYPMLEYRRETEIMASAELYYQRFTLQPLFDRYGVERSDTREDAIRALSRHLGAEDALGVLAAEGVRYVVIHDDVYRAQGQKPPRLRSGVRLLRTFGPIRIYRLNAAPVNLEEYLVEHSDEISDELALYRPSVMLGGGFYPTEKYLDYLARFRWMGQAGELAIENKEHLPVRVWLSGSGFSNAVPRRLVLLDASGRRVATTDVPPQEVEIRLGPIDIPPGTSHLRLKTSPGPAPLGTGDPRVASVYLSDLQVVRKPDLTPALAR